MPARATVLERLIAVVVACTALMRLNFAELSNPNCCAMRGTSFAASMTPSPSSIFSLNVINPKNKSVVCMNAVRQIAATCFIHCVNPSEYPLGTENIYSEPTDICTSRIPPRLIFWKNTLITQYAKAMSANRLNKLPVTIS